MVCRTQSVCGDRREGGGMRRRSRGRLCGVLALMVMTAAACGLQSEGGESESGGGFTPDSVEFLVHTGPGGGSDIFVRDLIAIMQKEDVISENWPVRNEDAGEGAGAMSYLVSQEGSSETISAITTTWLVTPLTIEGAEVSIEDLTPIAGLVVEPEIMAVASDSEYESLQDFVNAAKEQPGELVQVGGSTTEVTAINGKALQEEAGTSWKFLSFEEVGQRIAALLSGDADVMFGSVADFAAQVRAGKLKILGSMGPRRPRCIPTFPPRGSRVSRRCWCPRSGGSWASRHARRGRSVLPGRAQRGTRDTRVEGLRGEERPHHEVSSR